MPKSDSVAAGAIALTLLLSACAGNDDLRGDRSLAAGQGLIGEQWRVLTATAADGEPIALLQPDGRYDTTVSLSKNGLSAHAGCNALSGGYRLERGRIVVVDGFSQTLMGCLDQRLIRAEQLLQAHWQSPFEYAVEGRGVNRRLHLVSADGTRWLLQTRDAPYGHRPTRLRLEVAPQTRPCPSGTPAPFDTCLWVRERSAGPGQWGKPLGDWHSFAARIDGYQHLPGFHQLLEIKRYPPLVAQHPLGPIHVLASELGRQRATPPE
ncbi:META domain-containing protein [Pseudomonas sp. CGJS7]|uniref:META domain-containing protein n=1 Tax=Pseudomonas sp. CGJS7 TaxID=3109348 RepID=UPI00300A4DB6